MLIQPILIVAILAIGLVMLLRRRGSARNSAYLKIGMGLFVVFGIDAIIFPGHISWVAERVGVGRGTDLLLYLTVVGFAFFVVFTYARFFDLEARIARLSRAIALESAPKPPRAPGPDEPTSEPDQDSATGVEQEPTA